MNASSPIRAKAQRAVDPPLVLRSDMRAAPDAAALSGRMPRISAGVFLDSPTAETILRDVFGDRRFSRVASHFAAGGIAGAIAYYSSAPTPDLLILETAQDGAGIMAGLDGLAAVCTENTKVIVIGLPNDIGLYREMIAKGVSDYLIAPVDRLFAIAAILTLYQSGAVTRTGRICAFIGAKGGVGASTLAQNVAWCMGQDRSGPVMLADLDLQFGTAALNLNLNPAAGISEQALDADRLDEAVLERTLIQSGKFLHVLPASGQMHEIASPNMAAVEKLLDLSRKTFPVVILDLPHLQSAWMKAVLAEADDVVIVASPDLANLRNAKCLLEIFRTTRPNDAPPKLVLNQVGIAKRVGISPAEFAKGLGIEIATQIGFDPLAFVSAANEGRLIAEKTPQGPAGRAIAALARDLGLRGIADKRTVHRKRRWFPLPWG